MLLKKKIVAVIVCCIAVVLLAVTVNASTYTVSPFQNTIDNYDEIFLTMYEAIATGHDSVDLSVYKIKEQDLIRIYTDLIASSPEFFYLDNKITYYYNKSDTNKTITSVKFVYTMSESEREKASLEYEAELAYIVSLVDRSMSEVEKALWVHDYFVAMFSYDDKEAHFDAYSLFKERKGVCQAYSLGYIAVMRELGIDAVMISSPDMNHAWNLVNINGNWYHVDLSYDDPMPDQLGKVLHNNFLLNDTEIANTKSPHYGWESSISSTSTDFSDMIWKGVISRMVYLDEQWYYVDVSTKSLVVSDFSGRYHSDIYVFDKRWYVKGETRKYWDSVFSGVSEFLGYIFVNTPEEIIIYSPRNSKAEVYMLVDNRNDIYGSVIYKNTLEYMISESPKSDSKKDKLLFEITDFSNQKFGKQWPFVDVMRFDKYYSSIRNVYDQGLFQGVSDTKFAPNGTLTRAMFVTVIGRMVGVDTSKYTTSRYADVKTGLWYSPYIEWASEMGIVNGVGGNKFDPLGEITHEQAYKILAYCGRLLGVGKRYTFNTSFYFDDFGKVSDWAFSSVVYCINNSLIVDVESTSLNPKQVVTRAEAAHIISQFLNLLKNK